MAVASTIYHNDPEWNMQQTLKLMTHFFVDLDAGQGESFQRLDSKTTINHNQVGHQQLLLRLRHHR